MKINKDYVSQAAALILSIGIATYIVPKIVNDNNLVIKQGHNYEVIKYDR